MDLINVTLIATDKYLVCQPSILFLILSIINWYELAFLLDVKMGVRK